jgi:glycine cleavage system H protein
MKSKSYDIPDGLLYTKEHEWATSSGGPVRVGITDYAAKTLNDVVYVTLPKAGERVSQFKTMGTVESIKAVSELYSPLSGVVSKVNEALGSHPELVNTSPYGEGWLIEVKPDAFGTESKNLLDSKGYAAHLESITGQE